MYDQVQSAKRLIGPASQNFVSVKLLICCFFHQLKRVFWVLRRKNSMRHFFEYQHHIIWLRNKIINL